MTTAGEAYTLLQEHIRGEHMDTARGECPACVEITEDV
jgi:hypothetical protein